MRTIKLLTLVLLTSLTSLSSSLAEGATAPSADRGIDRTNGTCMPDRDGYCTNTSVVYDLSYKELEPKILLNVTLGQPLEIVFPKYVAAEDIRQPSIGNNKSYEFDLKSWESDRHIVTLRVKPPDMSGGREMGTVEAMTGVFSGINLAMETFEIVVKVRHVPDDKITVSKLIFKSLAREEMMGSVDQYFSKKKKEMDESEKQLDTRANTLAAERVEDIVADRMATRFECTDFPWRRMRASAGQVTLWGLYLCQMGDHAYIYYRIKNESAVPFQADSVHVKNNRTEKGGSRSAIWRLSNKGLTLKQDEATDGMAHIQLASDKEAVDLSLEIIEAAGQKRIVTLDDISF